MVTASPASDSHICPKRIVVGAAGRSAVDVGFTLPGSAIATHQISIGDATNLIAELPTAIEQARAPR